MFASEQCLSDIAPANVGRPSIGDPKPRQSSQLLSGNWTWRPSIPHRTSSMSTRRRTGNGTRQPDLATFHRRSCQLFTSLDSTLSHAASTASSASRTSTNTPPSLTTSVTTHATSIYDDKEFNNLAFPSLHLELQDPRVVAPCRQYSSIGTLRLGPRRSSSQLSPQITSTEQMFWTSEASRRAEYAKIDAAHSGIKGFVKKFLPRRWGWAHGKRRNFHLQGASAAKGTTKPDVDADSVVRYRVSIASAAREAVRSVEKHGLSRANTPAPIGSEVAFGPRIDLETYVGKTKKVGPVTKALATVRSSEALARMVYTSTGEAQSINLGANMPTTVAI